MNDLINFPFVGFIAIQNKSIKILPPLIHFFPILHFYTPWKHQKILVFRCFQGYRNVPWGRNELTYPPSDSAISAIQRVRSRFFQFSFLLGEKEAFRSWCLTLQSPTSQNGQTHSNNSSAQRRRVVWVCLTILWVWRLKD